MFAFLALAGDVGCTVGPTLVGLVADSAGGNLQTGLSFGIIFPVIMCVGIIVLMLITRKKHNKTAEPLFEENGENKEGNNDSKQS